MQEYTYSITTRGKWEKATGSPQRESRTAQDKNVDQNARQQRENTSENQRSTFQNEK